MTIPLLYWKWWELIDPGTYEQTPDFQIFQASQVVVFDFFQHRHIPLDQGQCSIRCFYSLQIEKFLRWGRGWVGSWVSWEGLICFWGKKQGWSWTKKMDEWWIIYKLVVDTEWFSRWSVKNYNSNNIVIIVQCMWYDIGLIHRDDYK